MGIVTLPRRFQTPTGQPASGDGCRVAHPGNPWTSSGAITIGTPPSWRATSANTRRVNIRESGIPYAVVDTTWTVLVWARPGSTTSALCGGVAPSGTAGGWLFTADKFQYRIVGSSSTIAITSTAGVDYVYVATMTPSGAEVFQNGTSIGTSASVFQKSNAATSQITAWVLGDSTASLSGAADIYLIAYWNRALSPAEIQQYSINPASLLVGNRRMATVSPSAGPSGSMAAVEGTVDSFSSSGVVLVQGTANVTENTSDTLTSSGKVIVQGSLTATEGTVDIFAGSGTTTGGRVGTANMTESTIDTFSGSGTILVQGSLSATENTSDTFFATNVVAPSDKCVNSKWIVNTGTSSGTIQLQMASDVNGVDVTLKEGLFFLKYRKIN